MENANYRGPSPPVNGEEESIPFENQNEDCGAGVHDGEIAAAEPLSSVEKQREAEEEEDDDTQAVDDESKMALSEDPTKVKFTNSLNHELMDGSRNGEAKVDIENVQLAFAGMGKEELLKYADDPFWVRLRWILFIFFWMIWLAMLVGAIAIVISTPGCPPLPKRDWWQKGVVYQVFPRSFMDSNGDGDGDLKGIQSKLSYFKELGVNTLWLNSIYPSPMEDEGNDVQDYKGVDSRFGTLDDFKELVKAIKDNGLYLVLDFIPNHSSKQHPWFEKSRLKEENYAEYYVWAKTQGSEGKPNNWLSTFDGSAWSPGVTRADNYLHQFFESEPDLNLRNPAVREELKNILKFWLDLGVDGFRVSGVSYLFEDPEFRDEPSSNNSNAKAEGYDSLNHIYTKGLPEGRQVLKEWRDLLDSYEEKDGNHRLLMVEVNEDLTNTMLYYGDSNSSLADFPSNFQLMNLNKSVTGNELSELISSWTDSLPSEKWSNWVLGSHDVHRVASRYGQQFVDAFNMIIMLLSGTPVTYYGEEIGMADVLVPYTESKDPKGKIYKMPSEYLKQTRDLQRTPMQWSNESEAGFSSGKSWLPVGINYLTVNVEAQRNNPNSHFNNYKKLVKLRDEPAVNYGDLHFPIISEHLFSFARTKKGSPGYMVLANFGTNGTLVDVLGAGCCTTFTFPDDGIVEVKSSNVAPDSPLGKSTKPKVSLGAIPLGPAEAVVIKFVPTFK